MEGRCVEVVYVGYVEVDKEVVDRGVWMIGGFRYGNGLMFLISSASVCVLDCVK